MPKKQKSQKERERLLAKTELSRLAKLEKAWAKASSEERVLFLKTLAYQHASLWSAVAPERQPLIADGRYLLPPTVARIERIMTTRGIRPDEVAQELGFAGEGTALTRGLAKGASLRLAMVKALAAWLTQQEQQDR